jgi:hypothetical protein
LAKKKDSWKHGSFFYYLEGDYNMLEQLKSKLGDEQVQRAILNGAGMIVTFVATQVFAGLMHKGIDSGVNALMTKLHPAVETPVA